MSFWKLPRKPEPEEMDQADEVESYSSAAAARHLDAIDNTFVDHLLRLRSMASATVNESASTGAGSIGEPNVAALPNAPWGLDIGTGPAQIPVKVLKKVRDLRMIGLDRSRHMLARARQDSVAAGVADRLRLVISDGHVLPFCDGTFSMVICNSVLHHVRDPVALLREMARVAKPDALILLRDLRRPSRLALPWHLWRHGRRYGGLMRKLFDDSVQAAYTQDELEEIILRSNVPALKTFRFRGAHIGIERPPK